MNGDAAANTLLLIGVASARIAVAFLLIPVFSSEAMPPMVRNSILVALALISLMMQPALDVSNLAVFDWARMYAKELVVGLIIGFFFGTILWSLQAAGEIIDAKVGSTIAQVLDPLTGLQTSLNGAFLGRLANLVFIFSGGLSLLVSVVLESYAIWPIAAELPRLAPQGLGLFEAEFSRLMVLATLFAAPALAVLFVIDMGLGLINRFAQQLNVFALSLSIKSFVATAIILMLLTGYVQAVIADVMSRPTALRAILVGLRQ